jgi:long-subunit fatty acid transport protein
VFEWKNAPTVRVGGEYRLGSQSELPVRIGYVFDATTTNERFPSAFGTPPAPTHSITAGAGYVQPTWQVNIAGAYRWSPVVTIAAEDLAIDPATGQPVCRFCSFAGDYDIDAVGLYVDASVDFDL